MAGRTGKKPTPKEAAEAKEPRTFFVRLELDESDHKRLRVRAAEEGIPMSAFVKRVVIDTLNSAE